jgi:hypothetical protein
VKKFGFTREKKNVKGEVREQGQTDKKVLDSFGRTKNNRPKLKCAHLLFHEGRIAFRAICTLISNYSN